MSIISNTYKYIFVHIPKTGGTTLTSGLAKFNTPLDIEIGGTKFGEKLAPLYLERYGLSKHSSASTIKKVLGPDVYSSFFSFAFVRDPYRRTLSIFSFLKSWRDWPQSDIMETFSNIGDFVNSDFFFSNGPDNILKPQHFWITDKNDNLLVNKIFKLEEFGNQYSEVLDQIGIKHSNLNIEFKPLNKSNKSTEDINILYDDKKIKTIVLDKYEKDFQLFNYTE